MDGIANGRIPSGMQCLRPSLMVGVPGRRRSMKEVSCHVRVLALLGVLASSAFSQTAQLTGTVTDPTGSVVPGAKIVATNIDTGVARATVANDRGNYLVTTLLPGKYRVTTEASGFKQVNRGPITLAIDQVARIDFILEVARRASPSRLKPPAAKMDAAVDTVPASWT